MRKFGDDYSKALKTKIDQASFMKNNLATEGVITRADLIKRRRESKRDQYQVTAKVGESHPYMHTTETFYKPEDRRKKLLSKSVGHNK